MSFIEQHGLWTDAQARRAREVLARIDKDGIETVRFVFADQHGIPHGKALVGGAAVAAMREGVRLVGTILLKDTSGRTAWPVFGGSAPFGGRDFHSASDVVLVPDPATFCLLPWVEKTAWMQCNAFFPDGRPVPYDTRAVCTRALDRLAQSGFEYVAGLEVEFYVFRVDNPRLASADAGWPAPPPEVSLLHSKASLLHGGFQVLAEQRYDQIEPVLSELQRVVLAMGMPLRSVEVELGPSQCEFVFAPMSGLTPADTMVLFRSAAKQVMRRLGCHVTFMCRPKIPEVMSSGWHLHQSLRDPASGRNLFIPDGAAQSPTDIGHYLSGLGGHFVGGLLAHAAGAAAFTTPTINGYRRYRPNSLAPDRAIWGCDNRGAMLRVMGAAGDPASRVENRVGEPAANPYLYMAAQIFSGLDGIANRRDPGPSADTPYETVAPALPANLPDALAALQASACMREGFGADFVDYFMHIKHAELARFNAEVSDWEQREYFDIY